jgi:hypothetical protein
MKQHILIGNSRVNVGGGTVAVVVVVVGRWFKRKENVRTNERPK